MEPADLPPPGAVEGASPPPPGEPASSPPLAQDVQEPTLSYLISQISPQAHTSPAQAALGRLMYGSLTKLQHGSRTSLPDIQEEQDLLFSMDAHAATSSAAERVTSGSLAGAPPVVDLSLAGQMPAGTAQSRTLLVRNVDTVVTEDELRRIFEVGRMLLGAMASRCLWPWPALADVQAPDTHLLLACLQAFGEISGLACQQRGFAVVSYYDIRAATLAKHTLQGQALRGLALDLHYSPAKDEREVSQAGCWCATWWPARVGGLPLSGGWAGCEPYRPAGPKQAMLDSLTTKSLTGCRARCWWPAWTASPSMMSCCYCSRSTARSSRSIRIPPATAAGFLSIMTSGMQASRQRCEVAFAGQPCWSGGSGCWQAFSLWLHAWLTVHN